jgi:hypothetical protein
LLLGAGLTVFMPLTINKRSSGSDRPRSARLRRRPSPQEDIQGSVGPESFEREHSELTNKKNTKSKAEVNLLGTSNRPSVKDKIFGNENHKRLMLSSMELIQEAKSPNIVNYYQRNAREPPKSPRILPKLEKNRARNALPEENTSVKNDAPQFSVFLDEKKRIDGGSLQLGKQYSVLPNISQTNEEES